MADPCRSCGERDAVVRRVCRRCDRAIRMGRRPDVRTPAQHGEHTAAIRHPDEVARRIAYTLSRYPHLKRQS